MTVLSFRFCPDGRGHSVFGIQSGLWALEWMSQQTCAAFVSLKTVYLPNPNSSFYSPEILTFIRMDERTDGHGQIDRLRSSSRINILYIVGNASFCLLHTIKNIYSLYGRIYMHYIVPRIYILYMIGNAFFCLLRFFKEFLINV